MPDQAIRELDPIDNPPVNNPYHWRDGWYFQRLNNDGVLVTKTGVGRQQLVIPANEWASIVAHVSRQGENGETFQAALDFHNREGGRSETGA